MDSIKTISWADVLQSRTRMVGLDSIGDIAKKLGYPYVLWNDRVYQLKEDSGLVYLEQTEMSRHSII